MGGNSSRNMLLRPLKKLNPGFKRKEFIGFDIETRYNNKEFLMATMSFPDGSHAVFSSKLDFIHEMMKRKYKGKIFCASFVEFDALGIFRGTEYEGKINPYMRDSFIFMIKTYVEDGKLVRSPKNPRDKKTYYPIIMQDTMAYAPIGVKSLGKMIGHEKLDHPACFNRLPSDYKEMLEMEEYCVNDSIISRKAMEFLHDSFIKMGIKPRLTIAATSMDNHRRNHMDIPLVRMSSDDIQDAAGCYKGALCSVFKRGLYDANITGKPLFYHDFNSMYPAVMKDAVLPHPNYMRRSYSDNPRYIMNYEGASMVDIISPDNLKYPMLPFKDVKTKRMLYALGYWKDTYTHIELRKALSCGYRIKKVYWSLYSTTTIQPFKYIKGLYDLRRALKREGSPLAEVYKLIMNASYGKFGEMNKKMRKMVYYKEITEKELIESTDIQRINDYFCITPPIEDFKAHCNPLFAGYITALARMKIWELILIHDPFYVDTDSIICDHLIEDSDELGRLKVEMIVEKAFFLRSKAYMCLPIGYDVMDEKTLEKNVKVKFKGIPKGMIVDDSDEDDMSFPEGDLARIHDNRLDYMRFMQILTDKKVTYKKFMRFKESIRRGKMQNETVLQTKHLDLDDTKRMWSEPLSFICCHDSAPLRLVDGVIEHDFLELTRRETEKMSSHLYKERISSDNFDRRSFTSKDKTIEESFNDMVKEEWNT